MILLALAGNPVWRRRASVQGNLDPTKPLLLLIDTKRATAKQLVNAATRLRDHALKSER